MAKFLEQIDSLCHLGGCILGPPRKSSANILLFCHLSLDKDRKLGESQAEIKALRLSDRLKEKAVEEVQPRVLFTYFLEGGSHCKASFAD